MKTIQWETVPQTEAGYLQRSRTPTGWLVREVMDVVSENTERGMQTGYEWRSSITFVPDPDHVWLKDSVKRCAETVDEHGD